MALWRSILDIHNKPYFIRKLTNLKFQVKISKSTQEQSYVQSKTIKKLIKLTLNHGVTLNRAKIEAQK